MKTVTTVWVFAAVVGVGLLAGCGRNQANEVSESAVAAETSTPVVKLSEIMTDPAKYDNSEVVLEGNFGGACCAADFVYKEGLESCEVYPAKGESNPKVAVGKPIRVRGVVKATQKDGKYTVHVEAKEVTER